MIPAAASIGLTGNAVTVTGGHEGTVIENTNATTDSGNRYEICDVSGFKCKPGELVKQWNGLWVHPDYWTPRNDQDFVRSTKNLRSTGPLRPEPVGSETFVDSLYPDGVSSDDL